MNEENQTPDQAIQPSDAVNMDQVCKRFKENITIFHCGVPIPQRNYCQGTAIPGGPAPLKIMFSTTDGNDFPATLALAGQFTELDDGGSEVFVEKTQTINLRIEWPGYDGWGAQIRTVDYREIPKSITRAKLVKEVSKQLQKFIEKMQAVDIDPKFGEYKVGPGGIEMQHIRIASLERVSRGSWQPRLFCTRV